MMVDSTTFTSTGEFTGFWTINSNIYAYMSIYTKKESLESGWICCDFLFQQGFLPRGMKTWPLETHGSWLAPNDME